MGLKPLIKIGDDRESDIAAIPQNGVGYYTLGCLLFYYRTQCSKVRDGYEIQ